MKLSAYSKIYNLGHRAVGDLLKGPVVVEEKVDGCVTPDTPVLTADLRYLPAGELSVGQQLFAFEDSLNDPRLTAAVVTHSEPIQKPCFEIITDSRRVVASHDHPWLVGKLGRHAESTNGGRSKRWVQSIELAAGDEIVSLPIWTEDNTREAGYLAGFYDGEGSLVRQGNGRCLSVCQRTGPTADLVAALLDAKGFSFSTDVRQRADHYSEVASFAVRGGWAEILRFLGTIRPPRLLAKSAALWKGAAMNFLPRETVREVRDVGIQTVTGLSTSTGTYVAGGMLCHNSQISFGLRGGELQIRSKGAVIDPDAPDKMFETAVAEILKRASLLLEGFTYRGEYLRKPKHNTLAYDRVPIGHVVIFDVDSADQIYLLPAMKVHEAERIGFECVPVLHEGVVESKDQLVAMLERTSFLGGQKIEGVVVKAYDQFGVDEKVLMAKHVSEAFKEFNGSDYRKRNPSTGDVRDQVVRRYRSEARWGKAVQHLMESGRLEHTPRDIGALIKEVQRDVEEECADEIKEQLYRWIRQHVQRGCVAGLAEWYKGKLMERQFEDDGSSAERPPAGGELVMHPLGFPLEVEPTVVVDPDHNLWTTFDDDDWNGEACRIWILNLQGEHVRMTPPEGIDPGLLVRICAAVEEQAASSCVVVWSETSVSR